MTETHDGNENGFFNKISIRGEKIRCLPKINLFSKISIFSKILICRQNFQKILNMFELFCTKKLLYNGTP